jgi:hypothetical protein
MMRLFSEIISELSRNLYLPQLYKYRCIRACLIVRLLVIQYSRSLLLLTCIQTEMNGLTGRILFDEEGLRKDYKLDVNELTVDSDVQKVSSKAGNNTIT